VTVVELLEKLAAAYGREPSYRVPDDFRPGDVRHIVHESSEIRSLDWAPETSLEEGLRAVAKWISGQGSLREYYSEALEKLRERGVVQSAR
jgi:nucleoside-diphosphate-sugar epimerase